MTGGARTGAAEYQIAAADPVSNTWLTANAGSGKTKVLTDRVARLLLGGADPMGILCLTYTKAAAAEMQNRLFKTLGGWAMSPDGDLRRALTELGEGGDLSESRLRRARQLFAKAIETPGGIRIQTIHSFCAALLRRFPLEAQVSPGFTEIDDRSALLLRDVILEDMALGPQAGLLRQVLAEGAGEMAPLLERIIGLRGAFALAPSEEDLPGALGVPTGLNEDGLLARVFDGAEADLLDSLAAVLVGGGANDLKTLAKLREVLPLHASLGTLSRLEEIFLTKSGSAPYSPKINAVPTLGALPKQHPMREPLNALMERVADARPDRLLLALLGRTRVLHRFAHAFLKRYERQKSARGWLDFDDLIEKATALLTDPGLSAWVLYRLDGGIVHVLVDEAQDTSPAQWRLIELLTAEFTAGIGRHDSPRTLFVVGDKKQSIYSFQGADVSAFDATHAQFQKAFTEAGFALDERPLVHSFRSSRAILRLVDHVFIGDRQVAMGGLLEHEAFHEALPGRVDFWPPVDKPEGGDKALWYQPEDRSGADSARTLLARQVAAEIRAMIDAGVRIMDKGELRAVHEGDFLILVRGRKDGLFEALIRSCKLERLQIAGADRLKLIEELAVQDVLAVLSFVNTPEDDLSLAAALRSPLCGLTEGQLFALAHGRKGYLWEQVRTAEEFPKVLEMLGDLLKQSEYLRPHELIDRILTRHHGRALLLGRLGAEAAEGLDELLSQAMAYEQVDVPSLTGFLVWMASGDVEAKRQAESAGRRIRVMTVHGAKGLEAPIVILPDTADRRPRPQDRVLLADSGVPIWGANKDESAPLQEAASGVVTERAEAESLRLLYVAATRARCWLIVAAAGKTSAGSWYEMMRTAAEQLVVLPLEDGRMRHEYGVWEAPLRDEEVTVAPLALPGWATRPPGAEVPAVRVVSPSDLGGAKTVPGEGAGDATAMLRGTQLHQMLERFAGLDAAGRAVLAVALGVEDALRVEAEALMGDPDLGWLFAPGTLAEVGFTAPWNGMVLAGSIDRLVIGDGVVTVVDYKSNAVVPTGPSEVPEGYLRQLGAYAHAMSLVYPGWRVEAAILWTATGQLMRLDRDIVRNALDRATIA